MAEEKKLEAPDKIKLTDKSEDDGKVEKKEKPKKDKFTVRFKRFIRDYKAEIKKIVWPSRDQVMKNTGIVVTVIIIVAAIVGVLDTVFYFGLQLLSKI